MLEKQNYIKINSVFLSGRFIMRILEVNEEVNVLLRKELRQVKWLVQGHTATRGEPGPCCSTSIASSV